MSELGTGRVKPDRYTAAICIRVRPDVRCADILSAKLPPVRAAKGVTDLRHPDAMFQVKGYFFFFLAVFFAFFAFLAMLPSVVPKVRSM